MNTTVISKQMNFWKKSEIALFENSAVIQMESLYTCLVMPCAVIVVSKEGTLPWMRKQCKAKTSAHRVVTMTEEWNLIKQKKKR